MLLSHKLSKHQSDCKLVYTVFTLDRNISLCTVFTLGRSMSGLIRKESRRQRKNERHKTIAFNKRYNGSASALYILVLISLLSSVKQQSGIAKVKVL